MSYSFDRPPLTDIAEIQRILRDQYVTASILKELVQNADDAGARRLHLGLVPGQIEATHPLLRSPAIVALNDGQFTAKDAKAIRCLGVGSKGSDRQAIGRFGLGLKSVFHLCEAFFYAASPNQEASEGQLTVNFINPWSGAEIHDDWDDTAEAFGDIRRMLGQWSHGLDRWFCLWLPLREPSHLDGKYPIVKEYPVPESVLGADLSHRIASLLTLLRTLNRVSHWTTDQTGELREMEVLELGEAALRRLGPELDTQSALSFGGSAVWPTARSNSKQGLDFTGRERLLNDSRFSELSEADPRWPTCITINGLGKTEVAREKAMPHAAVTISRTPAAKTKANLTIRRAVFLPLLSELGSPEIPSSADYQLLLHGCYFLDSGRRDIYTNNGGDPGLEGTWNTLLETLGTLPLVIPTLSDFVEKFEVPVDETRRITAALRSSAFIEDRLRHVCRDEYWICRVSRHHLEWVRASSAETFRTLPSPPKDKADLPFEVIPDLEALARDSIVSYGDWPRISNQVPLPWSSDPRWPSALTVESIFGSRERLTWFTALLRQERPAMSDGHWRNVLGVALAAVKLLGWAHLRSMRDEIGAFVEVLPAALRLVLPASIVGLQGGETAAHVVASSAFDVLLLPEDLVPDQLVRNETQHLSVASLRMCVQALARLREDVSRSKVPNRTISEFALHLVQRASAAIEAKRAACKRSAVFRTRGYATDEETLRSWDDLSELLDSGWLFWGHYNFAGALQKAVVGHEVVVVMADDHARAAELLFGDSAARPCDAAACVRLLLDMPLLSAEELRVDLLKRLLGRPAEVSEEEHTLALRYLLHANPEHFRNRGVLLASGETDGGLWERVAAAALAESGGSWRRVPATLSRSLAPEHRDQLNVQSVSAEAVEELLLEVGPDFLSALSLSRAEREEVLLGINDPELWRELPLHETVRGDLVAIAEGAYYSRGTDVPACLVDVVTVIARTTHPLLSHRYQRELPGWEPTSALRALMRLSEPWRHAQDILDFLALIQESEDSPRGDLLTALRRTEWLPTRQGARAPQGLVSISGLDDEIARLFGSSESPGAHFSRANVVPELAEHPGMVCLLEKLAPETHQSILILAEHLRGRPEYAIGKLHEVEESAAAVDQLLLGFGAYAPEQAVGVGFLRAALGAQLTATEVHPLAQSMCADTSFSTLAACLAALTSAHEAANGEDRESALTVFRWYLDALVGRSDFTVEYLRGLRLLNRLGTWRSVSELSLDALGIAEANLVETEMGRRLENRVTATGAAQQVGAPTEEAPLPASNTVQQKGIWALRKYFEPWGDHTGQVPTELVGAFIALLGGHPAMEELANDALTPRWTTETFRNCLDWAEIGRGVVGAGRSANELIHHHRFLIRVSDTQDGTAEVMNLLGEMFHAPLTTRLEHLFAGPLLSGSAEGHPCFTLTIRRIDPASLGSRLKSVLLESARVVLAKVYLQTPESLSELFEELGEVEQVDLEVTQEVLLKNALSYLQQLTSLRSERLIELRSELEQLPYDARCGDRQSTGGRSIKAREEALRRELRKLFEEDADARSETLAAVRGKVEQYQYYEASIPFELFQNSDDAVAELVEMAGGTLPTSLCSKISLTVTDDCFTWMHWGRAINAIRHRGVPFPDARRRGYFRDLAKMLVLYSSDKGATGDAVTGKFGLGFKSAFLFSDAPNVLSGKLAFTVVGGMFPMRMGEEDRQRLRGLLIEAGGERSEGTAIELRARQGVTTKAMIDAFLGKAHLLLAFARRIKMCEVRLEGGLTQFLRWSELPVRGSDLVRVGSFDVTGDLSPSISRELVLRSPGTGAVAFAIGPRNLESMAADTPTFWVTAPTGEALGVGFAVNGPFCLDAGRAQLARSYEANREIVGRLGPALGMALVELGHLAEDWPSFRDEVGLISDSEPYDFWKSLWRLTTSPALVELRQSASVGAQLLKTLLWAAGSGMACLVENSQVIPTCLPGTFRVLTGLRSIRFVTQGALDSELIFEKVAELPTLAEMVVPGQVVSGRRVMTILSDLGVSTQPSEFLTLTKVVRSEFAKDATMPPTRADHWGAIFAQETLDELDADKSLREEKSGFFEDIRRFSYLARDGHFHAAKSLVVERAESDSGIDPDEALRASFAPPQNVLDPSYTGRALAFFRLCRVELSADARVLAEWGAIALGEDRRCAFLRYVLAGKLSRQVVAAVLESGRSSWLTSINSAPELQQFDAYEQGLLRANFAVPSSGGETLPVGPVGEKPRLALQAIASWWMSCSAQERLQFAERSYPDRSVLEGITERYSGTVPERKAWITLFLRGALESIGRTTEAQHCGFLGVLESRGWIDELAQSPRTAGENAATRLRDYFDEATQEFKWLNHIRFYQPVSIFVHWIDEYAQAFLAVNRLGKRFSLGQITAPRSSSFFEGGGPDAPPIGHVLGMGVHYVLRELVRLSVVRNTEAHKFCFVPVQRVCRLVEGLEGGAGLGYGYSGRMSRADTAEGIWEFVGGELGEEAATFDGSFDVPLRVVAERRWLQKELLHRIVVDDYDVDDPKDAEEE